MNTGRRPRRGRGGGGGRAGAESAAGGGRGGGARTGVGERWRRPEKTVVVEPAVPD